MISRNLRNFKAVAVLIAFTVVSTPILAARQVASTPSPRSIEYEWMSIEEWQKQHAAQVEIAHTAAECKLLFLGDSITAGWYWGENKQIFEESFSQYNAVNFGIGGDQTQQVLWRLQNGALGKLQPELVVLLIGINNLGLGGHTPKELASGAGAIVKYLKKHRPNTKILLLGVFPAEENSGHPTRLKIQEANQLLEKTARTHNIHFADIGKIFLDEHGNIPKSLMDDFLHPTHAGYKVFARALSPEIEKILLGREKKLQ